MLNVRRLEKSVLLCCGGAPGLAVCSEMEALGQKLATTSTEMATWKAVHRTAQAAAGAARELKVTAPEWDPNTWDGEIEDSDGDLKTNPFQAAPVTVSKQTYGNGSTAPRSVTIQRSFTQSTYSCHPREMFLQWLWRCWETGDAGIQLMAQESIALGSLGPMPLVNAALRKRRRLWDQPMEGYVEQWPEPANERPPWKDWEEGGNRLQLLGLLECVYRQGGRDPPKRQ